MGKNLDKEYVKKVFEDKGCILLTDYINSNTPLKYICKCGEEKSIHFHKFIKQKKGCRNCAGLAKYSQEQVKEYFNKQGCKLLSKYTGANDQLEYICNCGNKSITTFWNFRQDKRCVQCGLDKLANIFKHDTNYVRQYFIDNNCIPLFDNYINVHEPLDYICECGNKSKIAFADFQNGKRCNKCRVERIQKTMYKNGTQKCSIQQKYLHNIIGGNLNYPVGNSSLDIAFPEEMIYVEYDGSGHNLSVKLGDLSEKEFLEKEKRRNYALLRRGWKEIRIISYNDKLPTPNIIKNIIYKAKEYLNEGHHWIKFIINDNIIESSSLNYSFDYGELSKV